MKWRLVKNSFSLAFVFSLLFGTTVLFAQTELNKNDFQTYQFSSPRVAKAYAQYNDQLKREFTAKGLNYESSDILIRVFKAHSEFEVWAKNKDVDTFTLFKRYNVCAQSGGLGPKRVEGDRQVPEGYYFISDFNPSSDFYLSLLVSYPNYSDLILGNKTGPGGAIYIHGGCLTVGCMPMTDSGIQEIYTLCLNSRLHGQTNIPVQIFPVRFNRESIGFLTQQYGGDLSKQKFWMNLKSGYDYFERNKKILPVMYDPQGKYVF